MHFRQPMMIPLEFQRIAGVLSPEFRVVEARSGKVHFVAVSEERALAIPPSSLCVLNVEGRTVPYLIDSEVFPELAESINLFGQALFEGTRLQRYLTSYRAYECLVNPRAVEFSAIRHSLSHPPALLRDKRARQFLQETFGGLNVNLNKWQHQKVFFRQLGRLVRETDSAIASTILANAPRLRVLGSVKDALSPAEVGPPISPDEDAAV